MVLTFLGAVLAWTLVDAQKVIRKDGSHVIVMKHPSWRSELLGLYETFLTDPWVVLLFPMFFCQQLVLPVPIQRSQCSEVQHPDQGPQQHIILD